MIKMVSNILIVFVLLNILSTKSTSYKITPENPVVKYNGTIVFEVEGTGNRDILQDILFIFPSGEEISVFKVGGDRIVGEPTFWNQYFQLYNFKKFFLFGVDYRLDGLQIKIIIFHGTKKIGEAITNPLKIEYQLESIQNIQRLKPKKVMTGKEIYFSGNNVEINDVSNNCLYGDKHCEVGFCCEDDFYCYLFKAEDYSNFFVKKMITKVKTTTVEIRNNYISIKGDMRQFVGCPFILSDHGLLSGTKAISYGEVFRRTNSDRDNIDYQYIGKEQINTYDISLLSSAHKNPYKLCSCTLSNKSCKIIDQSLVKKCTTDRIEIKDIESGILLFRVTNSFAVRDYDMMTMFDTKGVAGHIEIVPNKNIR